MSSLTCGLILPGAQWNYRILDTIKGDDTHTSTVFKAQVISHNGTANVPKWAIIKWASPDNSIARENLDRECQTYRPPGVAEAGCFQRMYDVIDKAAGGRETVIALEWMDTTLAEVLKEALTSCVLLDNQQCVNTGPDFKPANILLSGFHTDCVTAKVGDLGLEFLTGQRINAQPLAMRAPEVYLGQACAGPSQVWAVAAMLLCWIKPGVLGAADSPHFILNEAWSMAKIKRLFPEWKIPAPDEVQRETLKAAVRCARRMSEEEPDICAILPFEEETKKVEIPQQLVDLLRFMLVVNPTKRPSASFVLKSDTVRAFEAL